MDQMINELANWLENGKGHTVMIQKREIQQGDVIDLDSVQLQLEDVSVRKIEAPDPDGYLAKSEIILHGNGEIKTDRGQMPLPQNTYEIPLFGRFESAVTDNGLQVKTEKSIYDLYKQ
ncbi:hypothetical protein [Halalkalibacter urbisdiaboli]|uniref:hypothetical protein n=1 Tax=Halalkalibacter urbisdiaboli TaxID=1960589 RepID=UPI000B44755F|nr:hypothetical protein [Halalkalibacter urbisdiaboli]